MRWIIAVFALILVALQLELWFGKDRRPELIELEREVAEQSAVNQELAERNADLEAERANLKQGTEAIEERARSDLGLTQPDEDFYQIANAE
jgi:cell division protein FtsB